MTARARRPAFRSAELSLTDGDEARGRGFHLALQPLEELILAETRRDRIEHLDRIVPG